MISLAPISRAPYRSATTHQMVCALRYTAAMNAAADRYAADALVDFTRRRPRAPARRRVRRLER